MKSDVENTLNDDEFFADTVDTPKEAAEQHRKRQCLKGAISKGKNVFTRQQQQQAHERVYRANAEINNKVYAKYKRRKLTEKSEKIGKTLGRHVISLYSTGLSQMVKIRDVKKLNQDLDKDPVIKYQMAKIGYLLASTFGKVFTPFLQCIQITAQILTIVKGEDEGLKVIK